jgi:2-polyprenyl-3-methyl-5-hydroxy-6-metoxy-1,4-benzoquinol methylase
MSDDRNADLRSVQEQYENFPYPPRDPEDERGRLIRRNLGPLAIINHHCFGGRKDFQHGFRVLDAGGGTGDSIVHLAWQLRNTDAQLVYIDMSEQSMAIAQGRAKIRGLENIQFICGSLLDVPSMGFEPFDFIVSSGVLHHLVSPPEGLAALRAVLKDDGAMLLMLYARYGRTGVYQIQELLRLVNRDQEDPEKKIANTRALLSVLPDSNWFKRAQDLLSDWKNAGNAGIYDLFLHSIDRSYSIPELYEFIETGGMNIITFGQRQRAIFSPGLAYDDSGLGAMFAHLPEPDRQAAIELACGSITKHSFYAAAQGDTAAKIDDPDMIPFFFPPDFDQYFRQQIAATEPDNKLTINGAGGMVVSVIVGQYTAEAVKQIDGRRTMPEIVRAVCRAAPASPSEEDVMTEIKSLQARLGVWDLLLLRHVSTPYELTQENIG